MKFRKGSKVEVLSKKEVPSGSWRSAEIICGNGHSYTVRYDGFEGDAMNKIILDRVSRKAIRPCPPQLELSENWVCGDVVEVFDNFSWKLATVSKVLETKNFLVRLLGSSCEYKVSKVDIRVRQSWQDDQWVVIGKGSRNCNSGKHNEIVILKDSQNSSFQIQKRNSRIDSRLNDVSFPVRTKLNCQQSQVAFSKPLKRGSPHCYSQAGAVKKVRAVEDEGRCNQVFASNPAALARQVDVSLSRRMPGEMEMYSSFKFKTTGLPELDVDRVKPCDLESNDADSFRCSVGSCSISGSGSHKSHRHVSEDFDNSFCDSVSTCQSRYEEGNFCLPKMDELSSEIHRLELHAYRCTMEALHASGPLSWEQEELVTNLRLLLHITNDEHLMELKNLVSADACILFR